jgi:hypothetical protein
MLTILYVVFQLGEGSRQFGGNIAER